MRKQGAWWICQQLALQKQWAVVWGDHRRRRNPPQFHGQRHHHQGERQHYGNGFYQDAKSRLPSVKLPCFNGSSDPNVYLDWEAKCEQIFEIHCFSRTRWQSISMCLVRSWKTWLEAIWKGRFVVTVQGCRLGERKM